MSDLLLASNRGPLSWSRDERGELVDSRGGGGLVSALGDLELGEGTSWVCAAMSADDRAASAQGLVPAGLRLLDIDPETFDRAYNRVANSQLWIVAHLMASTPDTPTFDGEAHTDWQAYRAYGTAFADALAADAGQGARVVVQDYHLTLTPALLRERRPDLRIAHFSHTPWAPPEYFAVLPDDVAREVLLGMLGADVLGFLSPRWGDAFARCCVSVLGATWDGERIEHEGRTTRLTTHALGVDAGELRARADEADVRARTQDLLEVLGGRRLVVRVDRTELSKNIVRGLQAFDELLTSHPEHRGNVVHAVFAYASRQDLPAYRDYTDAVERTAREINERWGTLAWDPVHLTLRDDLPGALAGYQLADVLVVNPIRDGMNLVAKEGPVLSERGLALVLSREAGAADELGEHALLVNPFDLRQTAEAMHTALSMPDDERLARTHRLAAAAGALPPSAWLAAIVATLA